MTLTSIAGSSPAKFDTLALKGALVLRIESKPCQLVRVSASVRARAATCELQFYRVLFTKVSILNAHPNIVSSGTKIDDYSFEELLKRPFPTQPKYNRERITHYFLEFDSGSLDVWAEEFSFHPVYIP